MPEKMRMLREIVEEICAAEPAFELVSRPYAEEDLAFVVNDSGASFVISGDGELDLEDVERALRQAPAVRLMGLDENGKSSLYELRSQCLPLGDLSPQILLDAIWGAARTTA
jgi:hypothetical protein